MQSNNYLECFDSCSIVIYDFGETDTVSKVDLFESVDGSFVLNTTDFLEIDMEKHFLARMGGIFRSALVNTYMANRVDCSKILLIAVFKLRCEIRHILLNPMV